MKVAPTFPLPKHRHGYFFSGPCGFSYDFQMMMHNSEFFVFRSLLQTRFLCGSRGPTQIIASEVIHHEPDSFVQGRISHCFQRCVLITNAPLNVSAHIICFLSESLSRIISQVWDYAAKGREHFYGSH